MYQCAECKTPVVVIEKKIIKACVCDAPVIVQLEAEAKGNGGVSQHSSDGERRE